MAVHVVTTTGVHVIQFNKLMHANIIINLTLSAPNMTNDVLLNSPKWYPYFPFKQFGRI